MARYFIATCIASLMAAFAALGQLESTRSTVYDYYSEEKVNPAWEKDIITADGPNHTNLRDRKGVLVSKQSAVALSIAVSNLTKVAEAYNQGFQIGIANLVAATNNMPKNGITIGLVIPQEISETRTAIEGFIVAQEYSSAHNTDILTINFTQRLVVQPKIVCPYVTDGGMTTNNLEGSFKDSNFPGSNWTNVYSVTLGDTEYENCHKCYIPRLAWMQDATVWFDTTVKWGTSRGIDYGNIVHTAFGEELFNGILTNFNNHTYVEIKDGAIIGDGFIPFPVITNVTGTGWISGNMTGLTLDGTSGCTYEFRGDNLSGFETMEVVYEEGNEIVTEISLPFSYGNGMLSATMGEFTGTHSPYYIIMTSSIGTFRIPTTFQFP